LRSPNGLSGQKTTVDYDAIPAVIYTWPEVASVGKTEEELKAAAILYRAGKFPFTANPRARTNGCTEGFVKILAEARDRPGSGHPHHRPRCRYFDRRKPRSPRSLAPRPRDIARTCHAHPTLNEAVKEAALAVDGRARFTFDLAR